MYQRILVPIDGSGTSNQGLDEAIKIAQITGGRLRLVHVVALTFANHFEPFDIYENQAISPLYEADIRIFDEGKKRAQVSNVEIDYALFDNLGYLVPDAVATEARNWNADLIVIGTHGLRGVGLCHLGSDAEGIMLNRQFPCCWSRDLSHNNKAIPACRKKVNNSFRNDAAGRRIQGKRFCSMNSHAGSVTERKAA